jgi:hypothetical protein
MIKLKSELPGPPRPRRARYLLPLLLLVPVAALVEEHWRGHWELQSWKYTMTTKGEVFDPPNFGRRLILTAWNSQTCWPR